MRHKNEVYKSALARFISMGVLLVNRAVIKQFGFHLAVVLATYIDRHHYWNEHTPENNGWFICPHEEISEILNLSVYTIRRKKQELIRLGVLRSRMGGVPAKEWLNIDFDRVNQLYQLPTETGTSTSSPILTKGA